MVKKFSEQDMIAMEVPNLTRRNLLKSVAAVVASLAVGDNVAQARRVKRPKPKEYQQKISAHAIESDEGRIALAQSMVEPIRKALNREGVARRWLMADELPQSISHYKFNASHKAAQVQISAS